MEVTKKLIKNSLNESLSCEINQPIKQFGNITILILHAFTGKKENKTIHFLAKQLPNSSFKTIQFDFSGHGESEGELTKATVSKQLEDLNSVITNLNINKDNLVILGNSFAVITALAFTKKYPNIKGLILTSGRAKYLEYINNLKKENNKYKLFENTYVDESFINDYKKYEPISNIQKYNNPILIIHGTNDTIVPVNNAQEFYDLSSSKIKVLKLIKEADHRYSDIKFKEEVLSACINFLKI